MAGNLKDKFSEFVDSVADKYESIKETASELLDQGKSKVNNVAQGVKKEANSMTSTAHQSTNGAI